MQWVLHHLPGNATQVEVEGSRSGKKILRLQDGWRVHDFSWRGSMWNAPPRLAVWLPELTGEALTNLGLPQGDGALEARWINQESEGGRQALRDGLREKDVVIGVNGQPVRMNSRQFNAHLKLNYKVGDVLPLTILRQGQRMELKLRLVE
jgi:S1-C subfamily serine protease